MTIYFITRKNDPDSLIKIGYSADVPKRMDQLNCSAPGGMDLLATYPGGFELETFLHRKFSSANVGGEWFARSKELAALIDAITAGRPSGLPLLGQADDFSYRVTANERSTNKDREVARALLERLVDWQIDRCGLSTALDRIFENLYAINDDWSRRSLRAMWHREIHRIDYWRICDLLTCIALSEKNYEKKRARAEEVEKIVSEVKKAAFRSMNITGERV